MIFLQERISKLVSELDDLRYPKTVRITDCKYKKTKEQFDDITKLDTSDWSNFTSDQLWSGHYEYYWFEMSVTIPDDFDGKCVEYILRTGKENEWDAINPQFMIYVNGKMRQGLDVNHRCVILTECAKAGEIFRIVLSAFTGTNNYNLLLESNIRILDRQTEKYFYDISVPYNVSLFLEKEDRAYREIILPLNESLNLLDLRKPYSKEYYKSLEKAQEDITENFYNKLSGDTGSKIYCVGHTHIDVAWLWTLAVTEDKSVRSFSTVIELMEQYPEYIFMSSQPQLYKYVKNKSPELYNRIKEQVKAGRWETDGGMFVEADCNLASGEALVRQILYGTRFFEKEFGKTNNILWLPDVFGYSAALPQILKKSEINYFMTTKISWNEFNRLPYDTFLWEGMDGTKILTHFIPAKNYKEVNELGTFRTPHYTTYNGELYPSQVLGSWDRYQQKHLNDEVLMSFGFGDGGGGPTKEMLENQRRLSKGIPGTPRTIMSTANNFFEVLEKKVENNKYLPSWTGELYLEYHRGTYTSIAKNKKNNRKSEFALGNTEFYNVLSSLYADTQYPQEKINDNWEILMRNQFHDILPGSSIKEVYDDSDVEYATLFKNVDEISSGALSSIVKNISASKGSLVVFNPNSFVLSDIVEFTCSNAKDHPTIFDGDKSYPCQNIGENKYIFVAKNIPSKGYKTFEIKFGDKPKNPNTKISETNIENDYFSISLNNKGQFSSIFDKKANRETIKAGANANVIMTYEDKPHNYDAWDINNYYNEKSWEMDDVSSIEIIENGCVRSCLKISRQYLDSIVEQYVYVYEDIARIDIRNEIDWKEHNILVKTLFPMDIHSHEAVFDIQYGNVRRDTHSNTSWDFARFEVCHHKWLDISEDDYGISFLNDCKYGVSVSDSVVGLSMLKSAVYPNPDADKEHHSFVYSIMPHSGTWQNSGTVEQSYSINNPLTALCKENDEGSMPTEFAFVSCDHNHVVIESIKKAEDSDHIIVRVFENNNKRTNAKLTFAKDISTAMECNLLERNDQDMISDGNSIEFNIKPYEIKTFKIKLV